MNRALLLAAGVLALPACKKGDKKADATPAAKPTDKAEAPAPPPAPAGPWAAWDLDARKAAFQGAWVIGNEAWNVEGDAVTVWDGTAETKRQLAVQSPCEVKVTETAADGSSSATITHYTLKDGAVIAGLGNAGAKRGAEAVACISDRLVVLDAAGACTEWTDTWRDGTYKKAPGTCAFSADGTTFTATVTGTVYQLQVDGDALLDAQLASNHGVKAADFAAAKAARDKG